MLITWRTGLDIRSRMIAITVSLRDGVGFASTTTLDDVKDQKLKKVQQSRASEAIGVRWIPTGSTPAKQRDHPTYQ